MRKLLRLIARNPLGEYLRYLADLAIHSVMHDDFHLGYLSQVYDCTIDPHVWVGRRTVVLNSKIGSYSYVHHNTEVTNADIGRFCSIAPGCRIGLGKHPSRIFVSTHPAFYAVAGGYPFSFVNRQKFEQRKRIIIGNDVWISANVLIADGVTIGNGAIIGAGAVVVKSIPDYAIFGGVPARLIRYRFTQEEISWLNRFRWWDKDEQWLRAHSEAFQDI